MPFHPTSSKIHFNIILPSALGSSKSSIPQILKTKRCTHVSSPHMCYVSCPSHYSWLDHVIHNFILRNEPTFETHCRRSKVYMCSTYTCCYKDGGPN
jgi:hypothetical protein